MTLKRSGLFAAAALFLVALGLFAYLVVHTHLVAQRDVRNRFHDGAVISAAVTQSLFATSAVSTQTAAASQLGSPRVSPAQLDRYAARAQLAYALLRDGRGRLLASTSSTSRARRAAAIPPHTRAALGGRAELSNLLMERGKTRTVIEWAIPFRSPAGPRVLVSGLPEELLAGFLGRFLAQLPLGLASQAAVLDATGHVVGTADSRTRAAGLYPDSAAVRSVVDRVSEAHSDGPDARHFASAPIAGTPWRVVLTARDSSLYKETNGSRRTVPWLLLGAFALAGLAGLLALRRAISAQAEIYSRNLRRQHALEVNDNVIQHLAVMKYSLERGDRESTERKLTETLEEARRLVNEILGEQPPDAGDLRRRGQPSEPAV